MLQILAGISMHKGAAEYISKIVSAPIDFIGQFLFLARHSLKTSLSPQKMAIVLNGVAACGLCLANLSIGCIRSSSASASASATSFPSASSAWLLIRTVIERDIPSMIVFFIELLADKQVHLTPELKQLQLYVGNCILKGFDGYTELLNHLHEQYDNDNESNRKESEALLLQLSPGGIAVCNVMKYLKSVFDGDMIAEVFDRLCAILAKLTTPKAGANSAINDWNILPALRVHLPAPLSAVGEFGVLDQRYVEGLGRMSASTFHLCANLCQIEKGRNYILADGFLRRAIEKAMLLFPLLEGNTELASWRALEKAQRTLPKPSAFRLEVAAALHCIAAVSNHYHPQFGGANDVILHPIQSQIVEMCIEVMNNTNCPRQDCVFVSAIEAVARLAADAVCLSTKVQQLDIMTCVCAIMNEGYEHMNAASLGNCIDIVAGLSSGVRTPYMNTHIALAREPLTRLARLYPDLFAEKARETHWVMSRMGISAREMTTNQEKYFGISKGLSALGATLPTTPIARAAVATGKEDLIESIDLEYLFFPSLKSQKGPNNSLVEASEEGEESTSSPSPRSSRSRLESTQLDTSQHRPGTYNYCGPSTCGSLAIHEGVHHHGTFLKDPAIAGNGMEKSSSGDPLEKPKIFDSKTNVFINTGEFLPPSHQPKAEKRIKDFMDLYYGDGDANTPVPDKGKSGTPNGTMFPMLPAQSKSAKDLTFPMISPARPREPQSAPTAKSHATIQATNSSGALKQKAGTSGKASLKQAAKAVVRVSVDEIPELLMTKPVRK